jgi:hypothetical protein
MFADAAPLPFDELPPQEMSNAIPDKATINLTTRMILVLSVAAGKGKLETRRNGINNIKTIVGRTLAVNRRVADF